MSKFRNHRYEYTIPFGSPRHRWQFIGPLGGISFHVSIVGEYPALAGLEFHHSERCNYRLDEAPDFISCPVIGGPCRHDGTSLYASERLWPLVEPLVKIGAHDQIFNILEGEYEDHFSQFIIQQGEGKS